MGSARGSAGGLSGRRGASSRLTSARLARCLHELPRHQTLQAFVTTGALRFPGRPWNVLEELAPLSAEKRLGADVQGRCPQTGRSARRPCAPVCVRQRPARAWGSRKSACPGTGSPSRVGCHLDKLRHRNEQTAHQLHCDGLSPGLEAGPSLCRRRFPFYSGCFLSAVLGAGRARFPDTHRGRQDAPPRGGPPVAGRGGLVDRAVHTAVLQGTRKQGMGEPPETWGPGLVLGRGRAGRTPQSATSLRTSECADRVVVPCRQRGGGGEGVLHAWDTSASSVFARLHPRTFFHCFLRDADWLPSCSPVTSRCGREHSSCLTTGGATHASFLRVRPPRAVGASVDPCLEK